MVGVCEIKGCDHFSVLIPVIENVDDGSWQVHICMDCAEKLGIHAGQDIPPGAEKILFPVNVNDVTVMRRDASFWNHPGRATRYHKVGSGRGPFGHPVALCSSRIQLDPENTTTEKSAGSLMCRRCSGIDRRRA